MSAGLDTTQDALETMQKGAQKNLKRMQKSAAKNLKRMQKQAKSVQKQAKKNLKSVQEGAQGNLQVAQKNIQQAGDAMQAKRARASRRRWRRKMAFRLGLLTGVVAALLFAPRTGSEMRRQLMSFWQRISLNLQKMPDMLSSSRVREGVRAKETRPTRETTPTR
jgi:gas vesicle protein